MIKMLLRVGGGFIALIAIGSALLWIAPNDLLQGESAEVAVAPSDLLACVTAATKEVDGVVVDLSRYDSRVDEVPLKTSMEHVSGTVQRRSGGHVSVFIGKLSKGPEFAVRRFAATRVKALAAGISRHCANG